MFSRQIRKRNQALIQHPGRGPSAGSREGEQEDPGHTTPDSEARDPALTAHSQAPVTLDSHSSCHTNPRGALRVWLVLTGAEAGATGGGRLHIACQTPGDVQRPQFWERTRTSPHWNGGHTGGPGQCELPSGTQTGLGGLEAAGHNAHCLSLRYSRQSLRATSATALGHQNPCLNPACSQENPTLLGIHPEAEVYSDHLKPPDGSQWVRDTQPPKGPWGQKPPVEI